ncbi:L,D-transpeptidase [Changchengzhania lutea]|uniref:L,D-transpeptidase n=1 Tax=Changchengzhania lutea TaxID=2049305 RepID=UPI00115C642A|nr:L,D-transpeptidase [Changchengzhania lutea]
MFLKLSPPVFLVITLLVSLKFCCPKEDDNLIVYSNTRNITASIQSLKTIVVDTPITVGDYFEFLDSIVCKYDSLVSYKLSEHLLVRANPWIIDTLKSTDYYRMKAQDSFVYNQKKMIVLRKGTSIIIPDSTNAINLLNSFKRTSIDINIPEFKLRIFEDSIKRYEFPVRVGINQKKYLKMAGRAVDLKTKTGSGVIANHVLNPSYYNPVNGHRYFVTKRDDEKVTKLPQIPFIETEINSIRNGQLIHPTTNPITLGKAYSNGCIGTKEADAWVIYYYAPIGTKINIRYDLNVTDEEGKKVTLKDIYGFNK